MNDMTLKTIGTIITVNHVPAVQLNKEFIPALAELDGFSHINILWWADRCDSEQDRHVLQVKKPYKHSPDRMGVFATRSPQRPNPIALSTAWITGIDFDKGIVNLSYLDAECGSPVFDLKPYTPSLDRVQSPHVPAWCSHWPESLEQSAEFDWEHEIIE